MIWLRTAGVITEKEEKGLSIQSISDSQTDAKNTQKSF